MKKFLFAVLVLFNLVPGVLANSAADREHQIKAAFIYNFAKFISWPASTFANGSAPIVVGVFRDDKYLPDLVSTLSGKVVQGHSFVVRRIDSEEQITSCHIAVVGAVSKEEAGHFARITKGSGTCLVGDGENFSQAGGTIGFVIEANRIRFDINLDTARAANVNISSKLLSLARNVYQ